MERIRLQKSVGSFHNLFYNNPSLKLKPIAAGGLPFILIKIIYWGLIMFSFCSN